MQQRTPHCVTQCRWIYWVWETDCAWSKRKGLLLDCSFSAKESRNKGEQEQRRSEQTKVTQVRLDGQHVCEHECRTVEQPAARQVRLDRKWICKHEHRAAEQSAAMQAWNDAEEQNSLLSIVEMWQFSFKFFSQAFSHQKDFCFGFFPLIHVELAWI